MLTRDFDFDLPSSSIAQEPVERGQSRLLVLAAGRPPEHRRVADLPALLRPGDLLVVNDTRVIPARLYCQRETGAKVEILLVEKHGQQEWTALVKPGRKARPGTRLHLLRQDLGSLEPGAPPVEVLGKEGDGRHRIRFGEPVEPFLQRLGHMPLPPYVKRPDTEEDRRRYQTVYARADGAIAAPTAGLHFDEALLERLEEAGVRRTAVTLHVGIGTFKPVTAELVHEHQMDAERWEVPSEAAEAIRETREGGGRVVAVGTTVVRTLESAARGDGTVPPGSGSTELFIRPGYRFRAVDVLMTNFHLPRSTLLMLVAAFAGRERVLDAYRQAVTEGYRFYSYGDAMLVERQDGRESGP